MNIHLYNSIQKRLFRKSGEEKNNFILIKHYNTFLFADTDKEQLDQKYPHARLYIHDFRPSQMVGVFEPFLDYAREQLGECSAREINEILDQCGVYSLHKPVFRNFLKTGVCIRQEPLLIDEVAFEQDIIASAVVNLLRYIAGNGKIVFLLNDLQYANGSALHVIHNMIEDQNCKNIIVMAAYNEGKVSLAHIEPLWDKFYKYVCDKELVIETSHGSFYNKKSSAGDFVFVAEKLDSYIEKVNNLLFCMDFSHAAYYLEILYKMIAVEEMEIDWEHKQKIIELYTLVSIYTQDFTQALLLCGKLREIRNQLNDLEINFRYHYFMGLAHMYNGKQEEALGYAEQCYDIAVMQGSEYHIFVSKLLRIMAQMSGWHNIFFCVNDLEIEEDVLTLAQRYGYWNHLAHIYVYAYDNAPELYADETKLEERLVHFNKGIDIMKKLGNEFFLMQAYQNKTIIASTNGFFKTANFYYDKCHDMVRGKGSHEEAMIYNGVGYISSAMERYEKAFDCYNKALTIFLSLEEIDYVGETLYNMAVNCIMAQDYQSAYQYLEFSFRIVKKMKLNGLRVCNISKLAGLMAICSYYTENDLMCSIYVEKTGLLLEHLIEEDGTKRETVPKHDYMMCRDDLFIYYYVSGMLLVKKKAYEEALKTFEMASKCIDRAVGNQFYIFRQYITELAKLYRYLNREDEALRQLNYAIAFYKMQDCQQKVKELQAQLEGKEIVAEAYDFELPAVLLREVENVLRHVSVYKENQEHQKRMAFLSAWQKMMEIHDKKKPDLVEPAVKAFMQNFNIDKLVLLKYNEEGAEELFNNTGFVFEGEQRTGIENFFHRNRFGFVVSKIDNNYTDYLDIIEYFDKNSICSIIGIPFYYNDSLMAIMVTYIAMKDNRYSAVNRYFWDESDYGVYEFLIRQLLSSIDMLAANEKIQQMNDKLNHLAVTDKLTGLYNREGFYGNIENMISADSDQAQLHPVTIMYIDLDNFKRYNDTFGHAIGDIVLMEMACIFQKEVGTNGFAARYGGDEFLIALYTDEKEYIRNVAHNIYAAIEAAEGFEAVIQKKLKKTVTIPESARISCSIGISSVNSLSSDEKLERMIKEADKALYDVKKSGKGICKFYAPKV